VARVSVWLAEVAEVCPSVRQGIGWPAVVQAARGGLQMVRLPARVQARTCFTHSLSSTENHGVASR
jgi:hypothetical protein